MVYAQRLTDPVLRTPLGTPRPHSPCWAHQARCLAGFILVGASLAISGNARSRRAVVSFWASPEDGVDSSMEWNGQGFDRCSKQR